MCQRLLGRGWCQEWPELPESSPRQLPAPLQVSQCGVEGGVPGPLLRESRGRTHVSHTRARAVLPTGPCGGCEARLRTKSWY